MAKKTTDKSKVLANFDSKSNEKKTVKFSTSMLKGDGELLYGRDFYIWMLIGLGLIILGFILMAGGNQDPNEWNANEIYSFRRTGLAPMVIVAGLIVEVYAIFKK